VVLSTFDAFKHNPNRVPRNISSTRCALGPHNAVTFAARSNFLQASVGFISIGEKVLTSKGIADIDNFWKFSHYANEVGKIRGHLNL
jgi:hypothetical protein